MGGILLRIRTWWETADRTQKVVTVFGSAFLAFLLLGTYYFATRPKMALLYGGLGPTDLGRIVSEVQKLGIDVEYDLQGNVKVPSDKVAEVQGLLARNGAAPTTGHLGTRDLGNISMTTPKSVEEAQLIAVRQGEIAKAIEGITGVDTAQVFINPGKRGSFADEDEPPTASVTISEAPGGEFGPEQAKTVASMVAKSVPGLTVKNVSVSNQDGQTLFDGAEEESLAGRFATKGQAQANEAKRIKRELQPMLDRAFGPGNTLLICRVEMDFDDTQEKSEKNTPSDSPIEQQKISEAMSGGSGAPYGGGIAGAAGNIGAPATPDSLGPGKNSYVASNTKSTFPWDSVQTTKTKAPGTVTSLAISVLVDSKAIKDPKPVEKLLKGYLGPKFNTSDPQMAGTDPNFAVTVTPTEFDRTLDKASKAAQSAAVGNERMQQIFSILPVAALVLVAFFVIRAFGKVAKTSNVLVSALPGGAFATPSGALSTRQTGPGGRALSATEARALAIANQGPQQPVDVGEIQEKLDVPLEQIKKMAAEKPNTVAMLLKSWMLEDNR